MDERSKLLDADVLRAYEANYFKILKLRNLVHHRRVTRGQIVYTRFQLCSLGAQFWYSCVQKYLLSGLKRLEAARSLQNCPNNMSP